MAGLEGHPLGIEPETRRQQRTIVTDLRDMARALDAREYKEFFDGAWGLMERPEVHDPEVSALLKEFGSEVAESDQWQEAKNYLLVSITIARNERNAEEVRRHFDIIESLGLTEKLSENPEDAEDLATLWDQYMGEQPQATAQATTADHVRPARQHMLDQIKFAQYPGAAQGAEAAPQPKYIPAESVYPPNQDGIAVIPPNAVTMIRELGKGITGQSLLVRVSSLGPPCVLKIAKADNQARYELREEARALIAFKKQGILFVPRIEGLGPDKYNPQVFMEYIQGETIAQLRDRTSPLPLDGVTKVDSDNWEMAYMCMQLLQALAEIHNTGRIHCDLSEKPSHLMWANVALPDGKFRKQLKIIDFGNVVSPENIANVSPRTYVHEVVDAFNIILKYGFRLPVRQRITSLDPGWEKTIQATGNQDLITIATKIWRYKDAQSFCADMMPIFERMI